MATIPSEMDFSNLALGYHFKEKDVSILELEVKVYGLEEIADGSLPIAAVIATHGRTSNQKQMAHFACGLLGHEREISKDKQRRRDMIVVTLDLPNHGERLKNKTSNLAFDKNPSHLSDMAACVVGGCRDVCQIIDFLAAYLFPNGERVIDEYIPTGVSMGGNISWRLLREEPRVHIAVPIIGLPWECFSRYVGARAIQLGFPFAPPIYPPALRPLFETSPPDGAYRGKKILSIHGEIDTLVPYSTGKDDIATILKRLPDGHMEVWVQEGVGHTITVEMVKRTAEWIWRWALANEPGTTPASL